MAPDIENALIIGVAAADLPLAFVKTSDRRQAFYIVDSRELGVSYAKRWNFFYEHRPAFCS
jgi:hypothetical protein